MKRANLGVSGVLDGEQRWCVVHAENATVLPDLPDESVAHVITDPPFNQRTSENARRSKNADKLTKTRKRFIEFDGISPEDVAPELERLAQRWVIAFCALEQLGEYQAAAGSSWVRAGIWVKPDSAPQFTGDRPGQGAEGLAIIHRRGKKRWNGGGHRAVWTHTVEKDAQRIGHPTPKPVPLMIELISLFTDPDDIVLDPFCGSGTTGVACLRLGRRFIGIERDKKYAAVARKRMSAETQGLSLRDVNAGQMSLLSAMQTA